MMLHLSLLAMAAPGCLHGPTALRASRVRYNEVIRLTTDEQLLLNLVRLQYREAPYFLEVGNVSTQFAFTGSGNVGGTINEGPNPINPDVLGIGGEVGFEERPTVTFSPLQGREFVNKLLSPVSPETVVMLSRSGWRIDRVLRLTVENINGLDNASAASGPTPDRAPRYESFARVCELFRSLQQSGKLEMGYESRTTNLAGPLPSDRVSFSDVMGAAAKGLQVDASDDGRFVTIKATTQQMVWRVPAAAGDSDDVEELVKILGLTPNQPFYEIKLGGGAIADEQGIGRDGTTIHVATRSLMGALFYLAQAVEVPQSHRDRGLVTQTQDEQGREFDWRLVTGNLLRVHVQALPPTRDAISVRYRGFWYYIDEADLNSKSTFVLLGQLFALQAGGADSVSPVLTLPVGK